jgi:PTH1 family peptidyl-tRNA hydrolase
MHLVLGLGNPGRQYAETRHNIGFQVVDHLAGRRGVSVDKKELGAWVAHADDMLLAKPRSSMNESGQPAASLRGRYELPSSAVIVIHDDTALEFGVVQVQEGGGHRGHNGVRDVQARLKTNSFVRVRVGVSAPPIGTEAADHVLGRWTAKESDALAGITARAADAVEGCLAAMTVARASGGEHAMMKNQNSCAGDFTWNK